MDKDTADAIGIIEKQMAEKGQKIATLEASNAALSSKVEELAAFMNRFVQAFREFGK